MQITAAGNHVGRYAMQRRQCRAGKRGTLQVTQSRQAGTADPLQSDTTGTGAHPWQDGGAARGDGHEASQRSIAHGHDVPHQDASLNFEEDGLAQQPCSGYEPVCGGETEASKAGQQCQHTNRSK